MNEATISQDELNKLLMSAQAEKPALRTTFFSKQSLMEKFSQDKNELNRQLKELHISVTQEEVDSLMNKI